MAGLLKTSAITLAAALSTAASAQNGFNSPPPGTFEAWTGPAPRQAYVALPRPMTIEQKCRELIQFSVQTEYPKARIGFTQAQGLACKVGYGPDGKTPLLTEAYNLNEPRRVENLIRDMEQAAKKEQSLSESSDDRSNSRSSWREHREKARHDRSAAASPRISAHTTPPQRSASGGPSRPHESFEELRARRLKEANMIPR